MQDISSNFGGSTAVKSFTTAIIDGTLGGNWSMNGQPYILIENGGVTEPYFTAVSATVIRLIFNEAISFRQPDSEIFM